MKLLFRPDPFKDRNGQEIELEDIEIEYIKGEGCTACDYACGYATLEVSLVRANAPNSYISFEVHDWEDIQLEVEKIWNAGLSFHEEQFKRKENKFEKIRKQKVDLGKANFLTSEFHPILDIINEDDLN